MQAWSPTVAADARRQYLAFVRKSQGLQAVNLPAPFVKAVFSSQDKEDLLAQEARYGALLQKSSPGERGVVMLTMAVFSAQLDYLARTGL